MAVIIPVPINTGAVTQAAASGHIGPALWQLIGMLMILVCLPIMSSVISADDRTVRRRFALCAVLVFGVPTAVCIVAAMMGAPI